MYETKRLRTNLGIGGLLGSARCSSLAPLGNFDIDVVRLLFTTYLAIAPGVPLGIIKGFQRPSLAGIAGFGTGGLLVWT